MDQHRDQFEIAEMGDVVLQSGATLRGTKLAYKSHQSGGAGLNPVDAKFVNEALVDRLAR
jgi:hypothetical protein